MPLAPPEMLLKQTHLSTLVESEKAAPSPAPSPPSPDLAAPQDMEAAVAQHQSLAAKRIQAAFRGRMTRSNLDAAAFVARHKKKLDKLMLNNGVDSETLYASLERHANLCALKSTANARDSTSGRSSVASRPTLTGSRKGSLTILIQREETKMKRQEATAKRLAASAWEACDAQGVYETMELIEMLDVGRMPAGFPDGVANSLMQEYHQAQDGAWGSEGVDDAMSPPSAWTPLQTASRLVSTWCDALATLAGSLESMDTSSRLCGLTAAVLLTVCIENVRELSEDDMRSFKTNVLLDECVRTSLHTALGTTRHAHLPPHRPWYHAPCPPPSTPPLVPRAMSSSPYNPWCHVAGESP